MFYRILSVELLRRGEERSGKGWQSLRGVQWLWRCHTKTKILLLLSVHSLATYCPLLLWNELDQHMTPPCLWVRTLIPKGLLPLSSAFSHGVLSLVLLEDSLPLKKCIFLYLYLEIETDTDGVTKCKLFIAVCLPLESDYIVYLSPLVILRSVLYNRLSFWCLRILCHLQYSASWHCHRGECVGLANPERTLQRASPWWDSFRGLPGTCSRRWLLQGSSRHWCGVAPVRARGTSSAPWPTSCWKCRMLVSAADLLNLNVHLGRSSAGLVCVLKLEEHCCSGYCCLPVSIHSPVLLNNRMQIFSVISPSPPVSHVHLPLVWTGQSMLLPQWLDGPGVATQAGSVIRKDSFFGAFSLMQQERKNNELKYVLLLHHHHHHSSNNGDVALPLLAVSLHEGISFEPDLILNSSAQRDARSLGSWVCTDLLTCQACDLSVVCDNKFFCGLYQFDCRYFLLLAADSTITCSYMDRDARHTGGSDADPSVQPLVFQRAAGFSLALWMMLLPCGDLSVAWMKVGTGKGKL